MEKWPIDIVFRLNYLTLHVEDSLHGRSSQAASQATEEGYESEVHGAGSRQGDPSWSIQGQAVGGWWDDSNPFWGWG